VGIANYVRHLAAIQEGALVEKRNERSLIHETDAEELDLPGRSGGWLRGSHPRRSLLGVRDPRRTGEKVRPAPVTERRELSHIIRGRGVCWWQGSVSRPRGTTVLFPQGAVHMLHNTGTEEMKVVCFFAPSTSLENYRMHEDIDFPE
jgi:mannose-6-phosphate isomerase-like protein (cupin superfamily)